jgi:uncharacterized protein DUF6452
MIRTPRYLLIILMALCGIAWAACTQTRLPCLTPKTAILTLESMHKTSDTATIFYDTALTSAVFVALTKTGADTEKIFSQQATFVLSLSPDTGFSAWLVKTDTTAVTFDTIFFYYKRQLQFLSNACGYTYFYSLDSVHGKGRMIDSVHLNNTSVTTNVSTKHLQIYIHPDY